LNTVRAKARKLHNSKLRGFLEKNGLGKGLLEKIAQARIPEEQKQQLVSELVNLLAKNSIQPTDIVRFVSAAIASGKTVSASAQPAQWLGTAPAKQYRVPSAKTIFFMRLEQRKISTLQIRRAVNALERRTGSLPVNFFSELDNRIQAEKTEDPVRIVKIAEELVPDTRGWLEQRRERKREARAIKIQEYSLNRLLRMARSRYVPREVIIGIRRALSQQTEKTIAEEQAVIGMRHLILAELASRGFSGRVESTGGLQMLVFNPRKNPQLSAVFQTAYGQLVKEGIIKEKRSSGLIGAYLSPERSDVLQKYAGIVRR
jgi:hypothetical protein